VQPDKIFDYTQQAKFKVDGYAVTHKVKIVGSKPSGGIYFNYKNDFTSAHKLALRNAVKTFINTAKAIAEGNINPQTRTYFTQVKLEQIEVSEVMLAEGGGGVDVTFRYNGAWPSDPAAVDVSGTFALVVKQRLASVTSAEGIADGAAAAFIAELSLRFASAGIQVISLAVSKGDTQGPLISSKTNFPYWETFVNYFNRKWWEDGQVVLEGPVCSGLPKARASQVWNATTSKMERDSWTALPDDPGDDEERGDAFAEVQAYSSATQFFSHLRAIWALVDPVPFCLRGNAMNCSQTTGQPAMDASGKPVLPLHIYVNMRLPPSAFEMMYNASIFAGKTTGKPIDVLADPTVGTAANPLRWHTPRRRDSAFFLKSLSNIGIDAGSDESASEVFPGATSSSYYVQPHDLLGLFQGTTRDLAYDFTVVQHELMHAVIDHFSLPHLSFAVDRDGLHAMPGALEEAFADYFVADLHDNPRIGQYSNGGDVGEDETETGTGEGALRDLSASVDGSCMAALRAEVHHDSLVWSNSLWRLRQQLVDRAEATDDPAYASAEAKAALVTTVKRRLALLLIKLMTETPQTTSIADIVSKGGGGPGQYGGGGFGFRWQTIKLLELMRTFGGGYLSKILDIEEARKIFDANAVTHTTAPCRRTFSIAGLQARAQSAKKRSGRGSSFYFTVRDSRSLGLQGLGPWPFQMKVPLLTTSDPLVPGSVKAGDRVLRKLGWWQLDSTGYDSFGSASYPTHSLSHYLDTVQSLAGTYGSSKSTLPEATARAGFVTAFLSYCEAEWDVSDARNPVVLGCWSRGGARVPHTSDEAKGQTYLPSSPDGFQGRLGGGTSGLGHLTDEHYQAEISFYTEVVDAADAGDCYLVMASTFHYQDYGLAVAHRHYTASISDFYSKFDAVTAADFQDAACVNNCNTEVVDDATPGGMSGGVVVGVAIIGLLFAFLIGTMGKRQHQIRRLKQQQVMGGFKPSHIDVKGVTVDPRRSDASDIDSEYGDAASADAASAERVSDMTIPGVFGSVESSGSSAFGGMENPMAPDQHSLNDLGGRDAASSVVSIHGNDEMTV
jgi:hypothetical protein